MSDIVRLVRFDNPESSGFSVYAYNSTYIGDVLAKEDGFYDFWPTLSGGCWPAYLLRQIADELDALNEPLDREIEDFFSKSEREESATDSAETSTGKQSGLDF